MQSKNPTVDTPAGIIHGAAVGRVHAFQGIRYGANAGRFKAVVPIAQSGASPQVPPCAFPQNKNRLEFVMGDAIHGLPQAEDAFLLDLWVPENHAGKLPVLVFIHGGAFISGGGSGTRYDGAMFAQEQSAIVVSLNYRLGALGHLAIDRVSDGNLPFDDILCALGWIRDNIARFGGDPANVTVAGQSAGAWYAYLLGVSPAAQGLLRRNVLFSLPFFPPMAQAAAAELAAAFGEMLGGADPSEAAVEDLLAVQGKVMRGTARFGDLTLGFYPVASDGKVPASLFDYAKSAADAHIEGTLAGYTREENAAFMIQDPRTRNPDPAAVDQWFRGHFGAMGGIKRSYLDSLRPAPTPYTSLVDGGTHISFASPTVQVAASFCRRGLNSWLYRFDLQSGTPDLHSPHCMELPFLFANRRQWTDAAMLAGIDDRAFDRAGRCFRHAIGSFARGDAPGFTPADPWAQFREGAWTCHLFGDTDHAGTISLEPSAFIEN